MSVGDRFGHNVMGGVDVGIPGSVGKGGMGIGNWGGLNLNLGSLNVIGNGKNMLGKGSMIFFQKKNNNIFWCLIRVLFCNIIS